MHLLKILFIVGLLLFPQPLTASNVYEASLDSSVFINVTSLENGSMVTGSGVAVDYDKVLTVAHVCTHGPIIMVTNLYNKILLAKVENLNTKLDLCLLTVEEKLFTPVLIGKVNSFGADIWSIGGPRGIWPFLVLGKTSGLVDDFTCLMSLPATSGMSGAPIFHEGRLVGVLTKAMEAFPQMSLSTCGPELNDFISSSPEKKVPQP